MNFIQLAFSLVVLSKWRMVAVKPRFWLTNIRANAIDMIVGVSVVIFLVQSSSLPFQILFSGLYIAWLIFLKPASSLLATSSQAIIGQFVGLTALYLAWVNGPLYGLVLTTGVICYFGAHHFFDGYDEPYAKLLSYIWAYFGAALAWLLAHWLLYYKFIAQPTLILFVISFGLGLLYHLDHNKKLNRSLRNQIIFSAVAIIAIILFLSSWGSQVV